MKKGKIFIISGQSGVGKDTIIDALLKKFPQIWPAVTYTTRDPRADEIPGEDYYFVYQEKFQEMAKKGEFIEYVQTHGNWYGTPKKEITKKINTGKDIILELDYRGGLKFKEMLPEAITIFIKYQDENLKEILGHRLKNDKGRSATNEEIEIRYQTALKEKEFITKYDHQIVNPEGHPEQAIAEVERIIQQNINKS